MPRIGILSDTHASIHPQVFTFFKPCDELWHAGDIGNLETLEEIARFKPTRAVFGNCDGIEIRHKTKEFQWFQIDGQVVLMTHIGGYPGRYTKELLSHIQRLKPQIVVTGHSHILKVIFDKKHQHLHINPGAAGRYGLHTHITAIRFELDREGPRNLEILDIDRQA